MRGAHVAEGSEAAGLQRAAVGSVAVGSAAAGSHWAAAGSAAAGSAAAGSHRAAAGSAALLDRTHWVSASSTECRAGQQRTVGLARQPIT